MRSLSEESRDRAFRESRSTNNRGRDRPKPTAEVIEGELKHKSSAFYGEQLAAGQDDSQEWSWQDICKLDQDPCSAREGEGAELGIDEERMGEQQGEVAVPPGRK